jgi:hypothetical protein
MTAGYLILLICDSRGLPSHRLLLDCRFDYPLRPREAATAFLHIHEHNPDSLFLLI